MYEAWSRARLGYDREAMGKILAPEFVVLLYGQEIPREKFMDDVSRTGGPAKLTRFDVDILTVRQEDQDWVVVISEKLELELTGADGSKQTVYSLWVTRDGCRQEDGKWLVTSSEAIGHEDWAPGSGPAPEDW